MASGIGMVVGIILGVLGGVLFILAISVDLGYLGTGGVWDGYTVDALAVYGVISIAVAVGAYEVDKHL